jgi:hypothetical protein
MPLGFNRSVLTTVKLSPLAGVNSITATDPMPTSGQTNKFGGASINPQNENQYVEVDINAISWSFSANKPWTFEFWYQVDQSSNRTIVEFAADSTQTPNNGLIIDTGEILYFRAGNNIIASFTIDADEWYHIAMVCDGSGPSNNFKCYVDGDLKGTGNWTTTSGQLFRIGTTYLSPSTVTNKNSYIDELRVSDIERYTSNFTAPAAAFEPDLNTLLLMHFNFSPDILHDSTEDL